MVAAKKHDHIIILFSGYIMKIKSIIALFIVSACLTNIAIARDLDRAVDHEKIAVTANSGKPVTAEKVKQAIVAAASAKHWGIVHQANGKMQATLLVRNRHTIVVEITYNAKEYSIRYKDSINMRHELQDNQHMIHPNYNKWVQGLIDSIRLEIIKL